MTATATESPAPSPALGRLAAVERVLLINPPSGLYRRDDRCQNLVQDQTVNVAFPPIDLALLGAIAREDGIEARVADYPALGLNWANYLAELKEFQPGLVLFNITTATIQTDLQAARLARDCDPRTVTLARGEFFSRGGEDLLAQAPELDLALWGEIEENFRGLLQGQAPETLSGLLYRDAKGEVRRIAGKPIVQDLDTLPWPARELLDNQRYRSPETGRPITVIHGNRGCPAKCIYCPAGELSNYKLRLRDPEDVVAEIRHCVEQLDLTEFLFHGDTFTMNKRWLKTICERLIETGLAEKIHWGCNSRVDTMDAERAQLLKRAGCWVVAFGVESGDEAMLKHMEKGAKLHQAERALAHCREAGLATHGFFVVGLPWETRATLQKTYDFVRKLDPDFFDINIAYPLPGTKLYEIALRDNLVTRFTRPEGLEQAEPSAQGNYAQAAMHTYSLPADFVTRWRRRALLKLYARPAYILRTLARAHRSGTLPHYLRAGATRLHTLVFG